MMAATVRVLIATVRDIYAAPVILRRVCGRSFSFLYEFTASVCGRSTWPGGKSWPMCHAQRTGIRRTGDVKNTRQDLDG